MRLPSSKMFPQTCTIRRFTDAKSAVTGGNAQTYENLGMVACSVNTRRGFKTDEPGETAGWNVSIGFPIGTNIQSQDVIYNVPGFPNSYFSIESDVMDDAGHGAYLRVNATHKQGQVGK